MSKRFGGNTDDHFYRKRTALLRRETERNGWPCWLCGRPIDLSLPYTHRMSFTADHVTPIANGGKLLGEMRPAHRSCNSRRGADRNRRRAADVERPRTSRQW